MAIKRTTAKSRSHNAFSRVIKSASKSSQRFEHKCIAKVLKSLDHYIHRIIPNHLHKKRLPYKTEKCTKLYGPKKEDPQNTQLIVSPKITTSLSKVIRPSISLSKESVFGSSKESHEPPKSTRVSKAPSPVSDETEIDQLFSLIQERGKIELEEIIKKYSVSKQLAEEWAKILADHNFITIHYPIMGSPILILKQENKKENHAK